MTIELDLERLKEADFDAIVNAGITEVMTGIESNSPSLLESIGQKGDNVAGVIRNLHLARDRGLSVRLFYLLGLPEETWQTALRTLRVAWTLNATASFSLLVPYAGTALAEQLFAEGLVVGHPPKPRSCSTSLAVVRTRHLSSAALQGLYAVGCAISRLKERPPVGAALARA
jgi:radical SAM superfamily enzyme YgiQ (UPF0313 family)